MVQKYVTIFDKGMKTMSENNISKEMIVSRRMKQEYTNMHIETKEKRQKDMNAFLDEFMEFASLAEQRYIESPSDEIALFGIYVNWCSRPKHEVR